MKVFYLFIKIYRVLLTVLSFFFLSLNLGNRECIFSRTWKIIQLLSKFGSAPSILSFTFSVLWNILESSNVTFFFCWHHFLWDIFIFLITATAHVCHRIMLAVYSNSTVPCHHAHTQLFFIIPFMPHSNLLTAFLIHFLTKLLSLLSNSLSIIYLCKVSHGFVTGRQEGKTTTCFTVCMNWK